MRISLKRETPTTIAMIKNTEGQKNTGPLSLWFGLVIIGLRRSLEIAQGDDSHQVFSSIQNRQSADLPLLHQISSFVDVLAFAAANGGKHHHFPNLTGSRVAPLGCRPHGKVSRG